MDKRIKNAISECKEERRLEFPAVIKIGPGLILIDTRWSRDPRRANNGGEYYFWEEIWPNEYGDVLMQKFCSCDFWQPEDEPEILGLVWGEVAPLVRELCARHGIPIENHVV